MKNLASKPKKEVKNSIGLTAPNLLRSNFLNSINFNQIFSPFLIIFLIGGLALRIYKLDLPLGDWHSWRQADTAAVTWFLNKHFDFLHPHFFDISKVPSGHYNPNGYRFVEFPIYNLLHLTTFRIIRLLPITFHYPFEVAGRLSSTLMWLIGGVFLFYLLKNLSNQIIALLATFFYLYLPYTIYYSRTILPGPTTVSLSLISLYYWWCLRKKASLRYFLASLFFTALAVLSKPYAVFIIGLFPLLLTIKFIRQKNTKYYWFILSGVLSLLPFVWWRWWIGHFPQGIPANKWLLNAGGVRLKPVWWRWLFYERISKLILGGWGSGFLLTAFLSPSIRKKLSSSFFLFLNSLGGGALLYLIIFARGNIQHDYYQIMIIPALVTILGTGFYTFLNLTFASPTSLTTKGAILTAVLFFTFSTLGFSWYQIRDYYNINDLRVIKAIEQLQSTIPPQAKIITDYQGNSLLLYHFKRHGWPVVTDSIQNLYQRGASYYFAPFPTSTSNKLAKICHNIKRVNKTVLINLNTCNYVQN